jgi:hypothetical protein
MHLDYESRQKNACDFELSMASHHISLTCAEVKTSGGKVGREHIKYGRLS